MANTPTYLNRWQRARFRGVEFLTESHDAKGGRRLAVHEYPGAELPSIEDMGGKAWDYQLTAYFIGPAYDLDCNALLAQLAIPGADWLVHPWLGRLWVRAQQWTRREENSRNGFATLEISFVPGGDKPVPAPPDKVDTAAANAVQMADGSVSIFGLAVMSADSLKTFAGVVQTKLDMVRNVLAYATLPVTWSQQVMRQIASIKGNFSNLIALPGDYANALRGVTDALGLGIGLSAAPATPSTPQQLIWGVSTPSAQAQLINSPMTPATQLQLVSILANLSLRVAAVDFTGISITDSVVRANMQSEAALSSQLFLAATTQAALVDYNSAADRDTALQIVISVYEALLPAMPDAVFQAAVSARTALLTAVMAQDLPAQVTRDVVSPVPSTVLAYLLEVDEAAFIAKNKVRHPLFAQGHLYG